MSDVPLFVWPVGPIINTEPVRYVVNKTDHDRVVDALREQNRVLREALQAWMVYYEGHSTAGNRDRAYFMTRAALTATSQPHTHSTILPRQKQMGSFEPSQEGQHG